MMFIYKSILIEFLYVGLIAGSGWLTSYWAIGYGFVSYPGQRLSVV